MSSSRTDAATPGFEAILKPLDRLILWVGNWVLGVYNNGRDFVEFLGLTAKAGWKFYRHPHFTTDQLYAIGISSIPLVATTSVFTGAVTAWQAAYLFSDFIPLSYMGIAVGKSVMLEMGPVLTALVVAGRTGAGMTSELGAMSVTEQLDAMDVLGLDRHQFLVAPRIIAGVFMLPILIIISVTVALMGALAVAVVFREMEPTAFWRGVRVFYDDKDVYVSLIKAVAFGFIITSFGCYAGVRARNGAEGVGRAIEHSVQASAVVVLISNFLIGFFLL
jgi:phospholipid/cholesterol/gamma-HCH transport system permease protein